MPTYEEVLADRGYDEVEAVLPAETQVELDPLTRKAVTLHLCGLKVYQIAEVMNVSPITVSKWIRSEEAQGLCNSYFDFMDNELRAMNKLVLEGMRNGLTDPDNKVKAAFIEKWFRTQGKYKDSMEHKVTAEDVIKKFFTTDKKE